METSLRAILAKKDVALLEELMDRMESEKNFSLTSIVDELMPFLVMEANLQYGSFHQVKMNLFLRRLAGAGYFSHPTQVKLARLILKEAMNSNWIEVRGGFLQGGAPEQDTLGKMLQSLGEKNAHNAFFYAGQAYRDNPRELVQGLLWLSTSSIPDTLSHSFSCFLPVMADLVWPGHPAGPTALLSFLMFLSRFPVPHNLPTPVKSGMLDINSLLQTCASGRGIENLHHMITLQLFLQWEKTGFNKGRGLPFRTLEEWVAEKTLDQDRLEALEEMDLPAPANSYEEFAERFDPEEKDSSVAQTLALLESGVPAHDWLFRAYASYYQPDTWNPHFFTGLYSALDLYKSLEIQSLARRMAVAQALEYFGERVNNPG